MIKLSKRLEAIVNFCDRGKIIADIGTDHGFVPNFLYEQDRTRKIIAADISEKSLKKSLEFSKIRSNEKNIVHVISDGLKNIDGAENIIIAGMGGVLIADILEKDLEKSKKAEKLILQPMQQVEYLREYLYKKGFTIIDEKIVYEDKKYFQIILSKYTGIKETYNEIDLKISKILRKKKDRALKDFLENKLSSNNYILRNMDIKSLRSLKRRNEINEENKKYKEIIDELSN